MVAQHSKITAYPQTKELGGKVRAIADLNYSWNMALGHVTRVAYFYSEKVDIHGY